MKPKLKLYKRGEVPRLRYEVRGKAKCPITRELIFGYGYGYTMEQAYFNWKESPVPF